jgi:hypothetical protein
MFWLDVIFSVTVAFLIGLPFLSTYPRFDIVPYDRLFSSLSALSVVILVWERIADSRWKRLYGLMKRIYLHDGECKLQLNLAELCLRVGRLSDDPFPDQSRFQTVADILKRSGRFHHFDLLYPKTELESLAKWVGKYRKDFDDIRKSISDFQKEVPRTNHLIWGFMTGRFVDFLDLRPKEDKLVPVDSDGKANTVFAIKPTERERVMDFIEKTGKASSYMHRANDETWAREILQSRTNQA